MENNTFQKEENFSPKKSKNLATAVVLIFLIVLSFLLGYFLFQPHGQEIPQEADEAEEREIEEEGKEEEKEVLEDILIKWTEKKVVENMGLINPDKMTDDTGLYKYYKIGEIQSGNYRGGDLILVSVPYEEFFTSLLYILGTEKEGEFVIFNNYSTISEYYHGDQTDYFVKKVIFDDDYIIKELDYPEKIIGPTPRAVLEKSHRILVKEYELLTKDKDDAQELFLHQDYGQAYTDFFHNIFFKAKDNTIAIYKLEIDFYDQAGYPSIVWNDGTPNTQPYKSEDFSASAMRLGMSLEIIEGIDIEKELYIIGRNNKGDKIYFPIDSDHEILQATYRAMGGFSPSEGREVSYEEFLANKPIFLWVDPFGRLVKFTNSNFISHAEMAKPVIYLYPEKEERIRVEVDPKGGIIVSEPEYNQGWEVIARPCGRLTEVKTGNVYQYLFWESTGDFYKQPEKGFVVRKEDVSEFLIGSLSRYNFNQNEISDFLEFWLPFMEKYPYYFITFLETEEMDNLAPLNVSPKPDTVIRVLMDFSPLEEPIEVEGFEINSPDREGFTLIEWGGMLRYEK